MRFSLLLSAAALTVAACGDDPTTPPTSVSVTVAGLHGSGLELANAGEVVTVAADGSFRFATPLPVGATYAVSILSQPTAPSQTCELSGASGTVEADSPIDIQVTCKTNTYMVAGSVTGLHGTGVVLQDNGADDVTVAADGSFMFATAVMSGTGYAVTVKTQPTAPAQTCTVSGGTGTMGGGDVTGVVVNCATDTFAIGGTISGLAGTVVLHDGTGGSVSVSSNGAFAFPTTVVSGTHYSASVFTQPATPSQACVVTHASGDVASAAVTSIVVTCTTNSFLIGGTLTGIEADDVVIQNNGGDDLELDVDGTFAFATPVASGATFDITVLVQPLDFAQTCVVTGGHGTVGGSDVHSISLNCSPNQYTVSGTIGGLSGSVVLQNNAGDDITVSGDGQFSFPTTLESEMTYEVTVLTQPSSPAQTCLVTNDAGTIAQSSITNVSITCTTNEYAIHGTLIGLGAGDSIVLHDNGGDDLPLAADGDFVFDTSIASGAIYVVTADSPTGPIAQTCAVIHDHGTVAAADITDVTVACSTSQFTVGGTVTGLMGSVVLQDNGGDDLTVSADGGFTFLTGVPSGAVYEVTVLTQPAGLTCSVTNGSGTVGTDVTSVVVTCAVGARNDGSME